MKERFDGLVEHLLDGGLFLQQAIEILEKSMIQGALEQQPRQSVRRRQSNSASIAIRCSGRWWRTRLAAPARAPAASQWRAPGNPRKKKAAAGVDA